jgi:hypothetical protein
MPPPNPIHFDHVILGDPAVARQRLDVYGKYDIVAIASEIRKDAEELFAAIPEYVPVGVILPWLKTMTGTPQTLPPEFAECDGQLIDDRDSPFHTLALPNLNGENRFLRGNATSGGTGGADTHAHSISTATQGPSATTTAASGVGVTVPTSTHTHNTNFNSQTADGKPPYYNVVWIIRIK